MPGQGTEAGAFDEVLKVRYEKGIINALNNEQPLLADMKKETEGWSGREVVFPVKLKRNFSAGATAEHGTLHEAGKQVYEDFHIPVRYNHGRIRLSAAVMEASKNNKGAFARALGSEIDGLVEDMANYRGRVIWGWGKGVLALVNGDPGTGTTVTVDAPHGVAGAVNGSRYIQPGMYVLFVNPADGVARDGGARTVDTVAADGLTFEVTAAMDADVEDNDYIVAANFASSTTSAASSYDKEQMGLLGMVDTTTFVSSFHGIDRSASPGNYLQSTVISSVGSLSADVIQRAIDTVYQKSRGMTDVIYCEHSVRRAYLVMLENDRRYMGASLMSPDGGTKAAKQKEIDFGGIPIRADKDAPYGTMFGLQKDTFTRWIMTEGEWADESGAILRDIPDVDSYEAIYRIFDNFSCEKGSANWKLSGITANVVVVHLN
jgi:hypothetical protein